MRKKPLYNVLTAEWEGGGKFTPQIGLAVPSQGVDIHGVRAVLKELQTMGYGAYLEREDGDWVCKDPSVSVERMEEEVVEKTLFEEQ